MEAKIAKAWALGAWAWAVVVVAVTRPDLVVWPCLCLVSLWAILAAIERGREK